jgi:PPOX class probable F420-dependent enzyme
LIAEPSRKQREILESGRVARMATVDETGKPHIVPICYAFVSGLIYTPIDKKPKSVTVNTLGRIKNIRSNPYVSFVIDKYYEDWNRLYYLKITARASLLDRGEEYENSLMSLSEKYSQYRDMDLLNLGLPVIKILPLRIISWGDVTSGSKGR